MVNNLGNMEFIENGSHYSLILYTQLILMSCLNFHLI